MQGFPIEVIKGMKGDFHDSLLTSLAGNMCSTPVFLVVLCASIAAVSWDRDRGKEEVVQPKSTVPVHLKESGVAILNP